MSAVLVVRASSLGDIVHALPLVADVARHRPGWAVDWIAEEAFVPLVQLHAGVRRVVPVALRRWRHQLLAPGAWRQLATFRRTVREVHYGPILDLQEQMKGALIARLAWGTRHGFDRQSIREPVSTLLHEIHHTVPRDLHFEDRCRTLAGLALGYQPSGPPCYGLAPSAAPAQWRPAGRFAICVPATSRAEKLWPEPHWHELQDALAASGLAVLLPWGTAAERARSERLAQGHANAHVPPHRTLAQWAAIIKAADLVVGVDTGLVHLAAALGTPTVALFTATDPARAGVRIAGAHARDLGGLGDIPTPAAVREVAHTLLRQARD